MIVGSALFLCAAFTPISFRVFPEKSTTRKLEVIRASPTSWSVTQILFGLGALVTAIGVGLLAYALRRQPSAWLIWTSMAVLIPAAVLWLWHLYGRTVDPVAFAEGRWPCWPLLAYFILTEIGLAILGYALLRSDLPKWIGWMLIGSMVLLFADPDLPRRGALLVLLGDLDSRNSAPRALSVRKFARTARVAAYSQDCSQPSHLVLQQHSSAQPGTCNDSHEARPASPPVIGPGAPEAGEPQGRRS